MNTQIEGTKACINCRTRRGHVIQQYTTPDSYEQTVGVSPKDYWRRWISCSQCGLLRSEYSRDPKILHTIYTEQYRSVDSGLRQNSVEDLFQKIIQIPPAESETHFRVSWLMNALQMLERSGMSKSPLDATLLDVGGASGVFAYAMQQQGFQCQVLDPSIEGRFIEKYGIAYQQGYFETIAVQDSFDLISLLYVLEHLDEPDKILQQAKRILKPEGLLFFELPDASVYRFAPADHDAYNSCHLWLFGSTQFTDLLGQCGFSVLALQRYVTVRGYPSMMVLAGHAEYFDAYQYPSSDS